MCDFLYYQLLFKSVFNPVLKTDITLATFYYRIILLPREELKIAANGLDKISAASFTSFTGILSCPAALEHFDLSNSFSMCLGSTLPNSKLVSTGSPLLGRYFSGLSQSLVSIFLASSGPMEIKCLLNASAIASGLSTSWPLWVIDKWGL